MARDSLEGKTSPDSAADKTQPAKPAFDSATKTPRKDSLDSKKVDLANARDLVKGFLSEAMKQSTGDTLNLMSMGVWHGIDGIVEKTKQVVSQYEKHQGGPLPESCSLAFAKAVGDTMNPLKEIINQYEKHLATPLPEERSSAFAQAVIDTIDPLAGANKAHDAAGRHERANDYVGAGRQYFNEFKALVNFGELVVGMAADPTPRGGDNTPMPDLPRTAQPVEPGVPAKQETTRPSNNPGPNSGPGEWKWDFSINNMSPEARDFQARATGAPEGMGYYVQGVQFDGHEPGKLIEAKNYTENGRFMRDKEWQMKKGWDGSNRPENRLRSPAPPRSNGG